MQNTQIFDTIKRKEQGISNVAVFSLVKERRNPANKSSNKSSNRAPHTSSCLNVLPFPSDFPFLRDFSFSHSVYKKSALQACRNKGFFGKELKSLQMPILDLMKMAESSIEG